MAAMTMTLPSFASSQSAPLPFAIGEKLVYRVSVSRLGTVGRGAMWIEGPIDVRGTSTYLLRFDFEAGRGPMKAVDRTSSWLDPQRMASQRYAKHEKHVLARRDESVEVYPSEKRWTSSTGESGISPTDAPLDELSFMYFIRTLPLANAESHRFNRHFDPARSPTSISVLRREVITTGAGRFQTVLVEMRVKDPRRYKGEGVIRISLTDDAAHLPVRIESAMPVIGTAVMSLESYTTASGTIIARLDP
jgi:hypothetical protein